MPTAYHTLHSDITVSSTANTACLLLA